MSVDTSTVAAQCNLLNAPPLKKFAHPSASPSASLDDSFLVKPTLKKQIWTPQCSLVRKIATVFITC